MTVHPLGLSITKTDSVNAIVIGQSTMYTITIQYSGLTAITRIVDDATTPTNAFVPSSLLWSCTANAATSCVTGQPPGTDVGAQAPADPNQPGLFTGQSVDLQPGGELVYRLRARCVPTTKIPSQVCRT